MHPFDSPTLQRQGSGTRLQTLYGLLASLLVLLTVGTSTGWAQPTLATQAASAIICAGTAPTFDLTANPPDEINYVAANVAYAQNANQGNDISANFGDETVYHLGAGDIAGEVGAFPFTFYGTTHDLSAEGIYIGSNGFLRFENYNPNDNIEANEFGINAQAIPNVAGPNDAVYFLNIDLFPQGAGNGENIVWDYDNANDALVITFLNVSQFNVNNPGVYPYQQVTVQVVLWSDNSANPGRIDVNLGLWPNPIYIPNAHTIGVEDNCGANATAAGAPGAHNQTNWANAGVAGAGNGRDQTSWTFTPNLIGPQGWSARLAVDGGNGIRELFDVNTISAGDDVWASTLQGGDPTSLTGFNVNVPGTYNYYAVVLYDNCYQAQTDLPLSQVIVDPQPTVQVIQPPAANYCEGPTVYNFSVTPTVPGSTMTWSLAPLINGVDYTIVLSGANNQNAAITFPAAGSAGSQGGTARTISVTETGPGPEFCAITSNKAITVYTTPSGTITFTQPAYCGGATGAVTYPGFASFTGSPANTYAWSLTGIGTTGATLSNAATASPQLNVPIYLQPSPSQTVTLNLTATNGPAGLCTFTTSNTFVINPSPTAKTFTSVPTTYCTNVATTYTLGGTLAGNTYGYTFTGSGAFSGPDAAYVSNTPVLGKSTIQITWSGAGASSVTANETTPAGCTRSHTLNFTVSATPTPTILGSITPCQFLASAAGPPAFATNPTPQQYTYTLAAAVLTNGYRWSVPTGGTIVAVNGTPCTCANPTPSAGGFTVSGSAPSITVQWTGTGAHTVVVAEQGPAPNSCVGTSTLNVTVSASPTAANFGITGPGLLGATPPCQFQPTGAAAYTVTGVGQHNIQLNGGTAAAAAPYTINGGGDVISGAGPGTFGSVTWTATTGSIIHDYATVLGGCTSRETYVVTIQPLPTATIVGLTDVCGNTTSSYTASNPQNVSTYLWGWANNLAGAGFPAGASGGAIVTPAAQTTNINFGNVGGTYFLGVQLTGPAPSNCQQLFVMGITLTPQPAAPILAGFAPTTVCDSVSIVYNVTGSAVPGHDIRLTVVGGRFTAPSVGTSISFASTGAPQPFTVQWINSANGGTGFVTAIQYTTGVPSCTSTVATSPTITIVRQPNTTVVGPSPVCGNDQNVVYTASNPQFINTYLWGWSNDAVGTGFPGGAAAGAFDGLTTNPTVTIDMANVPGTYFLAVQVVNTTGGANCTKIFTKTIVLNAQPAPPILTDNRLAPICDSTNSNVPDYTVTGTGTAADILRITVTGGNFPWSAPYPPLFTPNQTTIDAPGNAAGPIPVFWAMGGNGGIGTLSAVVITNTVPACTSLVSTINQVVDPLPPFPTVALSPDPPGYCTDGVPVTFALSNPGSYPLPALPGSYTVNWTWPSPVSGTTPAGFVGAPNDPNPLSNINNEEFIVTNWTATPTIGFTTTFQIEIVNNFTGCARQNDYTVVVKPRPAPVVQGPVTACQEPTDPNGAAAGTTFINPRYTYWTNQVSGNFYNWSITNGYIVAYSTSGPGGPWIQTVATSTMPGGSPIQNASAIQVVFYGPTPGSVKVAEITGPTSPPGCQTTTPDYAVALDPLTPFVLIDNNAPTGVCFNDPISIDQNSSTIGHQYQLQISTDGGSSFVDVTTPSQAGTGGALSWSVPTGAGTQILSPDLYFFRSEATSPMGCISYTQPMLGIQVVPNPDTIPMSPLTDTICDTSPGIPFVIGPTVQPFVFYDLEREGPANVWTSYETYFDFAPPATITLTDNSNPPGAAAPTGIVYNYRVVAVDVFTLCSTILDTAVITVVDPCVPIIGAVNVPPGYNDDEVCIYGGFEEHLRTYKLATTPCFINTPGIILNWYTLTPPGSLVTGAVREQGGDTAVVEWYTTGGTQYGWIVAEITLPAAFGGCIAYDTLQVRVYPLPVPVIGTGPAQVCQNQQDVQYTATLEAGDTYMWEVVGGLIDQPVGATGLGTTLSPSTYTGVNANVIRIDWADAANPSATITLTQTSTVGCLNRTTRTITVNPTPTPSINGPSAPCGLDVVTYTTQNNAPNNSYQWAVQSGPGTIQSGATTNSIQFLTGAAGSATVLRVTETILSTGCSKIATFNVNPVLKPTPVVTRVTPLPGNVGNACLNTPMTYSIATVAGNSRLWSIVGGTITSATNANPVSVTWNTVGNQSLTVSEWVNASQCTTTVTQQVVVEPIPSPSITGPVLVCGSTSSNYSTPLVSGHTYQWSLTTPAHGNFVGSTTSNSSTILWNNPTPNTTFAAQVNVVETATLAGCSNSALLGVTVHRQPTTPVITRTSPAGNANQACTSDNITYSVTNNAGSTFLWNVVGGNIQSGQGTSSVVIEWTAAGNGTVSLTETTTGNTACFATGTLNVTVEDKPTPSVTGPTVVCGNAVVSYSTPAVIGTTYAWSITNPAHGTITSSATTNSINVTWNNPTPGTTFAATVNVTQTTVSGNCSGTALANVTVHRQPTTPTITRTSPAGNANQACTSDNITYSVTNNAGSTYLWNVTGGNIQSGQGTSSVVIEWTVAGNNQLTLTESTTANTACTATATLNVAVENKPTPTVTGPAVVCGNQTANYSTPAVAGDTYLWSIGNAAHGTITSSTTTNAITIMWNNPAAGSTFTALVTANQTTPSGNCSGTASLTVTVHRQPTTPTITRTSPAGNANQACTSDNITYSVTNNAGSTYTWNVVGGNIVSGQGTASVVIQWTVAGNNTLSITETTAANTACTASNTLNVAVEADPVPTVTGPAVVCGNQTANYSTPAVAGNTYLWTIGNAAHGTITSSTTTNAITILWNNPAAGSTFTALVTVNQSTASGNCSSSANLTVTIHRQPTTPVITRTSPAGNANQACTSDNITYSVTNNAGSTYTWNVVGGNIVSGQGTASIVIQWTVAGNNTLTVTETTTGNTACTASATLNVAVEADPVPTVTGPAVVCGNQTANYSTPAVAGNTYLWSIGNAAHGTITSSTTTNAITILWNNPAVNTTFTALVTVNQSTASGNCTSSANITVTVHRQPTPPTITRVSPAGNANQACTSDNITYSVVNNLGSTFVWNVTGGNIQSGQGTNSIVVEWTLAGAGSIVVTETTAGNAACAATTTLNVAVENKPTPTVTGPAVVCGNATSNYSTPAVAGDTYLWSIGNAAHGTITSSTTTNAITVMWNNPAAGSTFSALVTVTQTTPSGNCSGTANITVTVHRQPTTSTITRVTAGGLVNEACTAQTIQYSIPNNAGSSYNWTVTGANINSGQGTNAVTVTWNVAGTQTLTVVETTTANTACSATSTQLVTVEAKPTPAITGPSIACGNTTSTFSTPNVPGNSYAWTLNNAAFGTYTSATNTNSANILWNNPTPGATFAAVVTVTETTPTGNCVTATTRNVTIYRQPTVQTITRVSPAGNPNQACAGDNITYSVINNTGSTYLWNVVGGNIISGQATTTLVVEWTSVGNGSVTVTETTTANTACTATSTLNVTVEAKPNPSITGPAVVCGNVTTNYSTPAVAGNTYLWSINAALPPHGTITSSTTTNAITVVWNNPAPNTTFNAVLNVTESSPTGNCVTSTSINVTVHRQPTTPTIVRVSPAGNPNQACQGDIITYSVTNNAGSTYQWVVTGGNIQGTSTSNSVVVKWTVAGNGSLTVTETTASNAACAASATLLVGIEAKPNPSITGSTVVCGNSIQNYSTPAVAGNTYLWSIGNPAHGTITSSATSNAIMITWNNPTPGATFPAQVTVTETSPSGNCVGTATVTVTVHRQPTANTITRVSPAGNANQACTGDNITYSVTNNAGSLYLWNVTGGNIISGQGTSSTTIEWTAVGNQTLTLTESTASLTMCSLTNTLNVAVEAKPVPVISGPTVVCINTIQTHSTPFVAGNTYSWAITPDVTSPVPVFAPVNGWNTSNTVTLQWIQTGLHTLTVTQTSTGANCVGTASIQVRVNPIPTPAITSTTGYGTPVTARPGVVCAGSTHTYSVTPTPGNVFFWTVSGGSIVSGQNTPNLVVTWGSAGFGNIGITETIPGSTCTGTDLDTIDKRPVPTPLISGNINPCANATVIYTTPFVTGNTYTWSVSGPAGTTSFVVPGAPNQLSVTWGSLVFPATFAGTVSVTESVAAVLPANSCIGSNTLNVTVRPNPPAVTITASQNPVCASDLADVPPTINNVTYTTPVVSGVTYTWSITSNGTIVSGQGTNAVVARWTNTTTVPTTGTITVVLTTPFSCTSTGSFIATINPLPNPVIAGPTSVCQNTIQNYSSAGIPGNSYTWTLSGGNIIRSGQGTPNITVEWTLPGSHTLTLTETTIATGCTAMNTINVVVNPLPTLQITASGPTTFCQGGDVTLTAPLGFATYIWNTGQTGRSIVARTTGAYWVLVTDANGCSNTSDTIQVNVFPTTLPIITTTGPTTFCEGGSITLSAPSGFTAYLWSTGATTQSIVVTQSGTYTVTVADNNGCTGTSTEVDVFVNPKPTPVLTVIGTTTICSGDSVEVRAPAGYPSYTWVSTSGTIYGNSRIIFIKTSDTVYVTVSDVNGCPGTSDIVRVVLSSVTSPVVESSGPTEFCQGGSVTLSAPTGFANYIWSNGSTDRTVTVTESGTYTVTVTDNSLCAATSNATVVTVNPTPSKPTVERGGDTLKAVGPATTYQWYRDNTLMPGATSVNLFPTIAGAYRVEITDGKGCTNISDPFIFITTGVEDVTAGYVAEMRVYPNPTNGQFTIETEISQAGPVHIEVVNLLGESVLTMNEITDGGKFRVSSHLGDLANGVYSIVLTSGNERWTVRLVRQ